MLETLGERATNVPWALEVDEQYVKDQPAFKFLNVHLSTYQPPIVKPNINSITQ